MQLSHTLETKTIAGLVNIFIEIGADFLYIPGQFGTDFCEKFIKTLCDFGRIRYSRSIELKLINCSFIRFTACDLIDSFPCLARISIVSFTSFTIIIIIIGLISDELKLPPPLARRPSTPLSRVEYIQYLTGHQFSLYVKYTFFLKKLLDFHRTLDQKKSVGSFVGISSYHLKMASSVLFRIFSHINESLFI